MADGNVGRRTFLAATAAGLTQGLAWAEEGLKEPVYRVANANSTAPQNRGAHPLDPALEIARNGLERIRRDIKDYSCTVIKRERIKDTLGDYEYMFAKIRNRKLQDGKVTTPFAVYLNFLKPENIKGREVIWVEGQNNGKLKAHEGAGVLSKVGTVSLEPLGPIAMRGQLYPIYDIGVENLIDKLIEKGERDKAYGECEVEFIKNSKINGRVCTLLQVKHPVQREYFDFHLAQIFIDDEMQVPVRYAAYSWPEKAGGQPLLLEEYTYVNIKLNVGLTEVDFDTQNPSYRF